VSNGFRRDLRGVVCRVRVYADVMLSLFFFHGENTEATSVDTIAQVFSDKQNPGQIYFILISVK